MTLNKFIDHTLLKADATTEQIDQLIDEAKKYEFKSICINPTWVKYCAEKLKDSEVLVCTVIGFPLGANTSTVKAFEANEAIENGADEVDMVINIGALKAGDLHTVENDIKAVVASVNKRALLKVIIETCLLTEEEKIQVSAIVRHSGADFIKTSTGFSTGGSTPEDVALLRKEVGEVIGVKASGGVRTLEDAQKVIVSGATRIGTSNGVAIMQGKQASSTY